MIPGLGIVTPEQLQSNFPQPNIIARPLVKPAQKEFEKIWNVKQTVPTGIADESMSGGRPSLLGVPPARDEEFCTNLVAQQHQHQQQQQQQQQPTPPMNQQHPYNGPQGGPMPVHSHHAPLIGAPPGGQFAPPSSGMGPPPQSFNGPMGGGGGGGGPPGGPPGHAFGVGQPPSHFASNVPPSSAGQWGPGPFMTPPAGSMNQAPSQLMGPRSEPRPHPSSMIDDYLLQKPLGAAMGDLGGLGLGLPPAAGPPPNQWPFGGGGGDQDFRNTGGPGNSSRDPRQRRDNM